MFYTYFVRDYKPPDNTNVFRPPVTELKQELITFSESNVIDFLRDLKARMDDQPVDAIEIYGDEFEGWIFAKTLYEKYGIWCSKVGAKVKPLKVFGSELKGIGIKHAHRKTGNSYDIRGSNF